MFHSVLTRSIDLIERHRCILKERSIYTLPPVIMSITTAAITTTATLVIMSMITLMITMTMVEKR